MSVSLHLLYVAYPRAHEIYSRIGHERNQAIALYDLGEVHRAQFKYDQATSSYEQAKEIYARLSDNIGEWEASRALSSLRLVS